MDRKIRENEMTPTNKLRWLQVPHKKGWHADLILQQWWAEYDGGVEVRGEWRDVPIEEETE